ncbi:NAD(P)H-hydrate epimerase [Candidatus Nanohalovita haloferacivicina]|nr:NAD(P)H-hydrate epimerase [Candidatus Nanohalobia archaeon BNXNv]
MSKAQMEEIDRIVPEKYGISTGRLMENAGLQVAEAVRDHAVERKVSVYVGKGDNGGDGMVTARRLSNWDFQVEVVLASENLEGKRKEELEILKKMDIEINIQESEKDYPVAIDGLIGYSLSGDPRPPFDSMIREINSFEQVFSIDIATGLSAETGDIFRPAVNPDTTVTLAAPFDKMSEGNSGRILVADIGVPPEAYQEFGKKIVFEKSSLIRFN